MEQQYIDISMSIEPDMIVFDGDKRFAYEETNSMADGDICNTWLMTMGSHMGTHLDAPLHFVKDGMGIEQMPIETFIGIAKVIEIKNETAITKEELLLHDIKGYTKVLFKTRNSNKPAVGQFESDYVAVALDAAEYLVECGVKLIGVDYLSVERFGNYTQDSHKKILENNVAILEGIRLSNVESGDYELTALPLQFKHGNGSPTRAILKMI